jgi:hypothetical protein
MRGLTAAGLVLANGSQTLNVSAGASSFTFGSVLPSGSRYAVSVKTQPAGETCSITDGTGTTTTANVANVVIVCSAKDYSLGGTVRGLASSGLVLAEGDQTVSVAASATEFSFPAAIANGSSYAVIVKTQPSGLACAVTKGTGTIAVANVTSVVVTCTDQPFDLGGTISGLTTTGLTLANGIDTLDVVANATTFTMPTPVPFGTDYSVVVESQPTGLDCTVSHGSGTMPASAVTNVAVVCADQSYAVGGTISGLTASGLVLANGTDTLTVAASATGFTMPAAVAYGSTYAITVQAQPTGLTCTVSNATGTMPASAVTNVSVTCATAIYTVGGTISGLTASGLVLANGTDTTPALGAGATAFSMPTGVASGATYDVTVKTQPSGEICTVANGTGTVATSDVTNIAITCSAQVSFTTPGSYTWAVPSGVTSIQVVTAGGGGGASCPGTPGGYGGNGGVVATTLSVTPGDTLTVEVGGGGATCTSGYGGGGGGGSSNINAGSANQLIAGGGGGGGGGAGGVAAPGGNGGGNATASGSAGAGPGAGGGGGAGMGGAGGAAQFFISPNGLAGGNGNGGPGGAGGWQGNYLAGGTGAGSGAGGEGGNGDAGGGGGGGYGGGGGGGSGPGADAGGGGGGSTGPSGAVFSVSGNGATSSANGGDGSIIITY